jgi:hypothetical protein
MTPTTSGPAPIRGQADFHMLLLAPGLDTRWFFETCNAYWSRFRPMFTTRFELIELIPSSRSLAVTVLAQPDMVDTMRAAVRDRFPNVWFDLIVADDTDRVRAILDARAQAGLRFG